jgi:hypothetical protein
MVHQFKPRFPHRFNVDGTHDSICAQCHLTVASARNEQELAQRERDHVCDPVRIYQLSEDAFAHRTLGFN